MRVSASLSEVAVELNLIALAIPVFFLMIAAEYAVARRQGRAELYRWNDAINDLSCGISHEVVALFDKFLVLAAYTGAWAAFGVFDFSERPVLHWVLGIVGYDFCYYWWHRFTHRVNVGWAGHVVHHQSQEYNLAVALRQSVTTWITMIPFTAPLALLGVDPFVFAVSAAISLLYQFWIHTEVIDKFPGWFEAVMNTPSHHRVHHAINPRYLDKNYAGILIIWDRMFGTFELETEQPVYGTVKPLNSFDPLTAQFGYYRQLVGDTLAARTPIEKLRVWFDEPAYRPSGLPPHPEPVEVTRATQDKYDPKAPLTVSAYVGFQFVPTALGLTALELTEHHASWSLLVVGGALVLWSLYNWGLLHERRAAGLGSELARLLVTAALAIAWLDGVAGVVAVTVWAAASSGWLLSFSGWLTGRELSASPAAAGGSAAP